ncbi:MAG: DUF1203 domain-containing protein [Steroidobacteraceae bacterium]
MDFRIQGLSPEPFLSLYGLSDEELATRSAKRYIANAKSGFPDRIEMRDAEPGELLILVNYVHQPAATPYRASHAVFVLEGAEKTYDTVNEIPEVLRRRLISIRAFDLNHWMVEGDVCDGRELDTAIQRLLAKSEVGYLHAHYAKPGCYAARIERA